MGHGAGERSYDQRYGQLVSVSMEQGPVFGGGYLYPPGYPQEFR
jgi:hypothetical protein